MNTQSSVAALTIHLLILVAGCGTQPVPTPMASATARPAPTLIPSPPQPQIRPVEIRVVDEFSPSESGKELLESDLVRKAYWGMQEEDHYEHK